MAKKILLTFLFAILIQWVNAQRYSVENVKAIKAYENAARAFESRNTELAIAFTEEALKREPNFVEAHLFRFEVFAEAGKLDEAQKSLRKALDIDPDFFPNAWFFLGTLELRQGDYQNAMQSLTRFKTYRNVSPEVRERADRALAVCVFALEAMQHPVQFDPINLGDEINSGLPEYYPCLTADGRVMLYTRLRDDPQAFRGKNEDFYISEFVEGAWQPSKALREINTAYNEGAPSISGDGRILVFTACEIMGDYGPERTGYGSCDLFIAHRLGQKWSMPQNIGSQVNTVNWETQPSLSADGRTLYFVRGASTRQGIQNQDIYVTHMSDDGAWSKPQSVGPMINTPEKEESVMLHPDGQTLYFASNGHLGMGGMDLFVSRMDENGMWRQAENLGYPLNTHNDENSLHVGPDGEIALFASDRDGGLGKLDLYAFTMPKEMRPTPVTYAKGIVVDAETGIPLGAALELFDVADDSKKFKYQSDLEEGTFLLALPTGHTYGLSVKAEGYLYHSETFELLSPDANKPYTIEVRLKKPKPGAAIVLRNVFFDSDKDALKPASLAELAELAQYLKSNAELRIQIGGHTDNQGGEAYNLDLSDRRSKAVKQYLVDVQGIDDARIETKGYGQQKPIASNDTEEGRAKNRRTEFTVLNGKAD
jgi:outer membrane protein OmpA-like peptidoglycan-associated protein